MLGRGKPDKYNEKERSSFDDYLRGHIRTSNKTINIRGLFRVPDVSGGERLMINAEEKEEDIPQREQKEQIPIRDIDEVDLKLPGESNEVLHPGPKVTLYPLRRPTESSIHVEPSEMDYQMMGTTKYKIHATKTKTNVTSAG